MLSLGPLAFAAPWLLVALAALPVLWWLLRVTPPTPRRVSFPAVRLLHEAGVPPNALHLLPGDGEVGAALVAEPGIAGVVFTGSTEVARLINRALAAKDGPIVPLIAETGGVNAMINGAPEIVADFVAPWIAQGTPVVQHVAETVAPDQLERAAEEAIVRLSIRNLRTFPWIVEAEAAGRLMLHGFRFAIRTGVLEKLDGERLVPIEPE